ncbi:MAG: M48 family metallopeptidase [Alphaproteobacteria bacterium]
MIKNNRQTMAEVCYQGTKIPVVIERKPRAKRVRLKVSRKSGQVVLVLPLRASQQGGMAFAQSKADWIAAQLDNLPRKNIFQDGMPLSFLGTQVVIHHSPSARRGVWLDGNVIWVSGRAEHLPRRVLDFLKKEFASYALKKARETADLIKVKVQKVTIRDTVSRWGSCSGSEHLSLSWRLGLAPQFVADYVIAHEVAHLVEMNHSAAFWQVVAGLCPAYRTAELWLKKNAAYLYSFGSGGEEKQPC